MAATDGLRIRAAVRAVVLDPDDRVMLVRFEFPTATVWALPGGGIEPGECDHDALRRELGEELGLVDVEIGPHVWTRLHIVPFLDGSHDGQRDHVYLVRTDAFEPHPQLTWEQLTAERVHELRWWWPADLRDDDLLAGAFLAPRRLPDLLDDLITHGPPAEPVDTGV
ncbi:MAG: NUDIX domain-containing protein [Desertimonas sp.]